PMEPNRFGRKLGIGVRVASRMAKERAAQAKAASSNPSATPQSNTTPRPAAPQPASRPAKNLVEPARRVGEGTRRFGQAFFGPLKHVSGTLWLEITGLFFALFAVFFGQNAWNTRASAVHGPQHNLFLLYAIVTLVFLYFCISSFVKAMRRGRRRSAQ
ncbi:MAG: hypothetical protein WCB58_00035, partial [Acidobacteriaceae bacterium]